MPSAAVHAGLADFILPLDDVCAAIASLVAVTVGSGLRKVGTR